MSVPPATAAEDDLSEALGRVIDADVLPLDLADVGTSSSGSPSDAGPNSNPLNVGVIDDSVALNLGTATLPLIGDENNVGLLHLGQAGALSSYASSPDAVTSTASAGAVGEGGALDLDGIANGEYGTANVDLTTLLGQVGVDGLTDQIVDELSLELGALGSTATAAEGDVSSEYVVADGKLVISSPLVGDLSTELNEAVTGVGTTLNSAVGADGALGAVAQAADLDLNVIGVVRVDAGGGTIGLTGLDAALDQASSSLLEQELTDENGLVSINLADGTITVDLQQLGGANGLNGLPANTELLNAETIGLITGAVTEALGTVSERAGQVVVDDVLNVVGLTVEFPATVAIPLLSADVDIVVETTIGQLAGTAAGEPTVKIDGNLNGIPLNTVLNPLRPLVQSALITPLKGVVGGVVETATTGLTESLDGIIDPALETLSPVLDGVLAEVVSVTINEQPDPGYLGAESFTVNALSLELLPNVTTNGAVNVDLASSTVRAQAELAAPSITADPDRVPAGQTSVITGSDYPANTEVTVQLTDASGANVGDPVTVTTDADGGFTADLPVPAGTPEGEDYEVVATAVTGESATTPLAVIADDQADNTADNTAENTDVNTAENTGDNTADNTGENTEVNSADNTAENTGDNTSDNTGDNSADNTAENTSDNTGDNTEVNSADNTAENTGDNTSDNTGDNSADNTAENTGDNAADNTGDNTEVNSADNTAENTGDNTSDNTGDNSADNTAENTSDNTGDNTEVNTAENTEVNTGDNTEVNTADNAAENTEVNTGDNTEANTSDNTEVNAADNTADNTGDNTSDNTADNTARAEIDLTPSRAVEGVDNVLVTGTGYTPGGTAQVFLKSVDGEVIASEITETGSGTGIGTFAAVAEPGDSLGTVDVDENGEVAFRVNSSQLDLGDYTVTVIDDEDPSLGDSENFTVVPAADSDNTADNTADNVSDNTEVNTADNTEANTSDNTGDDATAEDPTLEVDPGSVEAGESTTVTGEGYPSNTEAEVQLVDPDGNPVGDPVTVTTDEDGAFETELTVPADAAPGDYTVDATAESGETATADLAVTEGAGDDNAGDNAGDSTADNTADNAGDSTADNTADNAGDNTADNAGENTGDNTGDDATAEDPAVEVDPGSVDAGDSTTVTGEGFPPNTEVEVQLVDADGNPVGDPVSVVTDENGDFTLDVTILDGTPAGEYTVVATAETGESASADLTVTGADNGNGGDGTSDNASDNTSANAGGSTGGNAGGGSTGGGGAGNGSAGSSWGNGSGSGGHLAQTGAAGTAAMVGLAALLLIAGSAGVMISRRSMS